MSAPGPRAMLALVVALGAMGCAALAVLLLVPGTPKEPQAEAMPLRSLGVAPFEARGDPSLAAAATRLGEGIARVLAQDMPQARVVAGRAPDVRFLLEGNVRAVDGDAELALAVVDARDGHLAGRAQMHIGRAMLHEPETLTREAAATARRILTAAMLSAAAE